MGIVIQEFGNVGTTALDAAVDGIAASTHLDKKAIDHGLKLFGNFERSTFEHGNAEAKQTAAVFQNAAEYVKPAQILKEFVGSPLTKQQYMVPYKDVVKNMEDPQFNVSDGLGSFTQKNITKTLGSLTGKTIIADAKSETSNFERKNVSNAENKELSNFERKDTSNAGNKEFSNFERKDLSDAQNKELSNAERQEVGNFEEKQLSNFERGVIYANNKPGTNSGLEEKGIIVVGGGKPGAGSSLEEKGIIVVGGAPADINDAIRLKQIQSTDHKPAAGSALEEKGIIIVNSQPADRTGSTQQISGQDRIAILQDSLIKLQKLDQVALQQLDLFEKMNSSSHKLY